MTAGLLSFAAAGEQMLPLSSGEDRGSPDTWAAIPLVAHDNQFEAQQAERLRCVPSGQAPAAPAGMAGADRDPDLRVVREACPSLASPR